MVLKAKARVGTVGGRFAAWMCLVVTLLLAAPYAATATVSRSAGRCKCCAAAQIPASAAAFCCEARPKPAWPAPVRTLAGPDFAGQPFRNEGIAVQLSALGVTPARVRPPASPPPLHPILRI